MHFLRTKALLQIGLILIALFIIYTPAIEAANACCEKTTSGNYCQYTDQTQCDPAYNQASTSCDQTQYCGQKCCYEPATGTCNNNVPAATCSNNGGNIINANQCNIPECNLGCCQLGDNYQLTTPQQCTYLSRNYPSLQGQDNYDEDMTTEEACLNKQYDQDQGCCVNYNTCSYTTQEQCNDEFHRGTYCSSLTTCDCQAHATKKCDNNGVYWHDSCGNQEELVQTCSTEETCKQAGNEASCQSANCKTTQPYPKNIDDTTTTNGGKRLNGESWCVYEGPTGKFLDYPGTQHYKHYCYQGTEYAEPCRDYREEVCIQATYTDLQGNARNEATCLTNIHKAQDATGLNSNITTVPLGQAFWNTGKKQDTTERVPEQSPTKICKRGNSKCDIYYVKPPLGNWECAANCDCEEQAWYDDAAFYCKAQGDCGPDYNIEGKRSTSNIKIHINGDRGITDIPPGQIKASGKYWKDIKKQGIQGGMQALAKSYTDLLKKYRDRNLLKTGSYNSPGRLDLGFYYHTQSTAAVVIEIILTIVTFGGYLLFKFIFGSWADKILKFITFGLWDTDDEKVTVTVLCKPYIPPKGGTACSTCTKDPLHPCTEYKCRSLGTACRLINEGTDNIQCIDDNPNDVNSPIITPWQEGITAGYQTQPTPKGYIITPNLPAYHPISFAVQTNEAAYCSYDTQHTTTREDMERDLSETYQTEHNTSIYIPAGRDTTFYVRCEDTHGNENLEEYEIIIISEQAPDYTAPLITERSINNNGYLPYNTNQTFFSINLNEPANCRYDKQDTAYENMHNRFIRNNNTLITEEGYSCDTLLTNMSSGKNDYNIRCQDNKGNTNQQSILQTLTVTPNPLSINTVQPQGIIYTNNITLTLITAGGIDGKASCAFSTTNASYIEFFTTDNTQHLQTLTNLPLGNYHYYYHCQDQAGNIATALSSFTIDIDIQYPQLHYIYKDTSTIHIVLDEPALCEYSDKNFSPGTGTSTGNSYTKDHNLPTNKETYLACKDNDGNQGPLLKIVL